MRIRLFPGFFLPVVFLVIGTPAAADTLVRLDSPELYDLQMAGFELPRATEVRVEAVGIREHGGSSFWPWTWDRDDIDDDPFAAYAWILDAETREPVWRLGTDGSSRLSGKLREAEETIRLERGRYEVYLFSGYARLADWEEEGEILERRGFWENLFSDDRHVDDVRDDLESCHVTLSARGLSRGDLKTFEPTGGLEGSLLRLNGAGDGSFNAAGFELKRAASVRVYSIIEHAKDDDVPADYGWIIDAETREIVWQPRRRATEAAGGGKKNRLVDEQIELPAGRYVVYQGTDDSHSLESFNVNPPHDPLNWGLTLLAGDDFDPASFEAFEVVEPEPLIDLARAGDDAFASQPFRLTRAGRVHVRALGEYVSDYGFADEGWIVEAASGRIVWEMTESNTIGAGGAEKNRMFDGLVSLDAGDYVLYYTSDGSHSFADWNRAAPFLPEAWGAALRPGPGFDAGAFERISEAELDRGADYLVRLVGVRDDQRLRQEFEIEEPAEVRIYALGEGERGDMFDYGYIVERGTERVVWEMEYGRTRHAGGADKNRVIDEQVKLAPGAYEAIYVSDGSHSFEAWNARRPRDPLGWGITIRR